MEGVLSITQRHVIVVENSFKKLLSSSLENLVYCKVRKVIEKMSGGYIFGDII